MGKNGKAMREAKRNSVTYTFTKEQLAQHDAFVIQNVRQRITEDISKRLAKEYNDAVAEQNRQFDEAWNKREKLFCSDSELDRFYEIIGCGLAVSCRVLCRLFGWKPINGNNDAKKNIAKFAIACQSEIQNIAENDIYGLSEYADGVCKETGLRFTLQPMEEDKAEERIAEDSLFTLKPESDIK